MDVGPRQPLHCQPLPRGSAAKFSGRMEKPQIIEHIQHSLPLTIYDTKWIPSSARFVLLGNHARGTGAMHIYALEHGKLKVIKECEKKDPFKCGSFGASTVEERHFATGDFGGRMSIWDLERTDLPIYTVAAHEGIINSLDGCGGLVGGGAPEIVTGARDGAVRIWDPRQPDEPVASLEADDPESARDCWAVAFGNSFNDDERMVAAGYDNGDIKLFDLRKNAVIWERNIKNGICGVAFDRKDIEMNKLAVVGLEAKSRFYDLRTQHTQKGFAHCSHRGKEKGSTVWAASFLPQNRDIVMTCGGGASLSLMKYNYPKERSREDDNGQKMGIAGEIEVLNTATVSTQPVASFDWSRDKLGLCVMGSYDQAVRVCLVTKLNLY
jgi:WD repeat-containing protein 92